ncbi:MAG: hypothetical protein ACRENI_13220 [Gemmatimonadaceae bacterium]
MLTINHRRSGFALVIAILAIVVIGALIAGAFFASMQEYRIGRNSIVQERALATAERGHSEFLINWDSTWNRTMRNGDTVSRVVSTSSGALAGVKMTRLNQNTFWVVSSAIAGSGTQTGARRRTGLLMRLRTPNVKVPGAITTANQTAISGSGIVSGTDVNPAGWDCDDTGPPKAGVVNDDATEVTTAGTCSGAACIAGSPKIAEDPAAGDTNTYTNYNGFTWQELVAQANVYINAGSGVTITGMQPSYTWSGACDLGDNRNWGDPVRNVLAPGRCESYYPIIHVDGTGTVQLSGGIGQGILLIEGNVAIAGNFEFTGLIIARGTAQITGTGNKVWGGLMAMDESCVVGGKVKNCNMLAGNATVQYSRCAVSSAFASRARPEVATRAWADMF